jgi:putative transposase
MRLLVRPDTLLRWHRDLIRQRHAARSRPKRPGRPPTVRSVRVLVLRLVRDNPGWGYRRVHGELLVLGVKVAASTVWEILKAAVSIPRPNVSWHAAEARFLTGAWLRLGAHVFYCSSSGRWRRYSAALVW